MDPTEQLSSPTTTEPSSEKPSNDLAPAESRILLSRGRTAILISALNGTVLVGAMNTGMMTVGLPRMAKDLSMSQDLQLWPALVYSLASGCTLLLTGAIADVVGSRLINLLGTFVLGAFILASGRAQTGIQLIMFRACQGIGVAMCFPTAVSILSAAFPHGRVRNIAFGCLGLGTPMGFAIGILLGGCFDSVAIGWRPGFYVCAAVTMTLLVINLWCLPQDHRIRRDPWSRLKTDIDWIGVTISSTSMGLLSYSLSVMARNPSSILEPANMLLLVMSLALIPLFVIWMNAQKARGKPALIPNPLWRSTTFSAICIMVLLSWAALQAMEWFISLLHAFIHLIVLIYEANLRDSYQEVQHLSALETAIRFLPNVTAGSILNISTGLLVHRVPVNYLVVVVSAICAISPLLMAIIDPAWSWWWCAFWSMLLLPIAVDVNFTVANLVITDIFPAETQALAGAVYQAVAQLGISIGIAIMAVISNAVTLRSPFPDKTSPQALMQGYRAVFWACFVMTTISTFVGLYGLRGVRTAGTGPQYPQMDTKKENFASKSPNLPPLQLSTSPEFSASLGLEGEALVDANVNMYGRSMVSLVKERSGSGQNF